jgi:MFS family permease
VSAGRSIFLYYLCGVFAAAQLGKLAALAPLISRDLQLGLAAMAALTSLLEVCGALLGGAAGRGLPRLGLRLALTLAVLALAGGAFVAAFAPTAWVLAVARLLESLGYLAIVVAAPVLIARTAPPQRQAAAMALWSTFVPVGMAVGAWAYAHAAGLSGWRWAQGLSVLAGVAIAAALHATRQAAVDVKDRAADLHAQRGQRTGALIWALVAAFGAYAVAEVGLLALLPTLLTQSGMTLAAASTWTAVAALANVPASFIAARLMRCGVALAWPLAVSLGVSGLMYVVTYHEGLAALPKAVAAVIVNLFSGVFATLVFALLPRVAGDASRLSLASGRLTQFGASGALIGPPLVGAVVEHFGWSFAGGVSLALSALAIWPAVWAWRRL